MPSANATVTSVTDYSALVEVEYAGVNPHAETQIQVDLEAGDFSAPVYDTGWLTGAPTSKWLTGHPDNTDHKLQVRVKDTLGAISDWSDPVHYHTRRIFELGSASGFESENEGSAPDIVGTFGSIEPGLFRPDTGWPELAVITRSGLGEFDLGWRARAFNYLGLYDQTPAALKSIVRYVDPDSVAPDGSDSRLHFTQDGGMSVVMVLTPEDIAADSELFGGQGAWVVYHKTNGKLGWFASDPLVGNRDWVTPGSLTLIEDEPNLIIVRYRVPTWTWEPVGETLTLTRSEVCDIWLNGVKQAGSINQVSNAHSPPDGFFTQSSGAIIDVGHASINTGSADAWASGGTVRGIVSEFVYWNDLIITDLFADDLWSAFDARDRAAFDALITGEAVDPIILDHYSQPKPPEKPVLTVTT